MMMSRFFYFFFFSSRRRHTRCSRDWSSDVCSSDLEGHGQPEAFAGRTALVEGHEGDPEMDVGLDEIALPGAVGGQAAGRGVEGEDRALEISLAHLAHAGGQPGIGRLGEERTRD